MTADYSDAMNMGASDGPISLIDGEKNESKKRSNI